MDKTEIEVIKLQVNKEKNFQETLVDLIDKKGKKTAEVFRDSLLSKSSWQNIINPGRPCKPRKDKVFSLAIALNLDLDETIDLLTRAGYAFCPNSLEDMIIKECIKQGTYDNNIINEILYDNGCEMFLGSKGV